MKRSTHTVYNGTSNPNELDSRNGCPFLLLKFHAKHYPGSIARDGKSYDHNRRSSTLPKYTYFCESSPDEWFTSRCRFTYLFLPIFGCRNAMSNLRRFLTFYTYFCATYFLYNTILYPLTIYFILAIVILK